MKIPLLGLLVSLFVAAAFPLRAASVTVVVDYYSLSPNPVNINVGDIVYWEDDDDFFAPYIITGAWGFFYTPGGVQFFGAGTYHYTAASIYGGGSWSGTINVSSSANSLPVVTITNPTNNSVFTAPATFTFSADAYDLDGDLWDVEFWVGDEMVDDVYFPPYETTVTNLAAGTYILKAIAWDFSYATATNTISITVVNPGPISLAAPALANGNLVFNASGLVVGKTNVLQYSTNLISPLNWVSVSTNVASSSTASFTNTITAEQRFFRLLQIP